MRLLFLPCLFGLVALFFAPVHAQDATGHNGPVVEDGIKGVETGETAASDESGSAEARGALTITPSLLVDGYGVVSGGLKRGTAVLGIASVSADYDARDIGLDGVMLHANVQYVFGRNLSEDLVGDAQVVSNAEAIDALRPIEVWASYSFEQDAGTGTIKAGLIDLNGDFDVQEVGSLFINSSHGIGPDVSQSGLNGPSIFPTTTCALSFAWEAEDWAIRVGAFNAVSGDPDRPKRTVLRFPGQDGFLLTAEADLKLSETAIARIGGWQYTRKFERIDRPDPSDSPSRGAYGMLQYVGDRSGAWLRAGIARDTVNEIGLYLGGGASHVVGPGTLGLAFAHARLGNPARVALGEGEQLADRAETNIELTWRLELGRFAIQPDVQYIINPGWNPDISDAVVVGVRLTFN